jgi:AraC-like DNA-binding protein
MVMKARIEITALNPAHRTIAYETEFGDLSNFNHLFRRRYGATPSDIREGR